MIGSSRETVARAMRNLVEQNVIEVTRTDIALKNRQALLAAARRERAATVPRPA
jgi:DNA-binding transcriptional regulator YhcF (GntR family)